jgi:hypothetical protein
MNRLFTLVCLTLSAEEKSFTALMGDVLEIAHTEILLVLCPWSYSQTSDSTVKTYHEQTDLNLPYLECRRKMFYNIDV